jgi:hypothetical protein
MSSMNVKWDAADAAVDGAMRIESMQWEEEQRTTGFLTLKLRLHGWNGTRVIHSFATQ